MNKYRKVAELIKNSNHTTVFTGAGVSVESGVPPFRGEDGLWNDYDPIILDLKNFYKHPEKSWDTIKEIFMIILVRLSQMKRIRLLLD